MNAANNQKNATTQNNNYHKSKQTKVPRCRDVRPEQEKEEGGRRESKGCQKD